MLKRLFIFTLLLCSLSAWAQQDSIQLKYANTITVQDLRKHLEIIASDEFEGRDTGRPGQKKAAKYIKNQFIDFGYKPIDMLNGFYQPFKLQVTYPDTVKLRLGSESFTFLNDMYYFPGFGDGILQADNLVYLGYGIDAENYSDYEGVSIKDKVVLISSGEPTDKKGNSLVTGTKSKSEWTVDWTKKINLAQEKGAKALLILDNNLASSVSRFGRYIKRPDLKLADQPIEATGIPLIYVNTKTVNAIFEKQGFKNDLNKLQAKISKKRKPLRQEFSIPVHIEVNKSREELESENVLAYLEGTEKPEELVIITAHYDHLGKKGDQIFNGADDDGSGTVSVLEMAEAFALAKKDGYGPKRSMLFMTVSGEEKGLLGSKYYTDNPVFPLENTVANLNIDMIGRIDEHHAPDSNYVYIIGSDKLSTDLHTLSEQTNDTYTQIAFDYTYNDENDPNRFYYRSDHYNFAKNNIPVIFYFTGVHEDYHQPTDTIEKIMFHKMKNIAHLIFHTAWEIANREERLEVDKTP